MKVCHQILIHSTSLTSYVPISMMVVLCSTNWSGLVGHGVVVVSPRSQDQFTRLMVERIHENIDMAVARQRDRRAPFHWTILIHDHKGFCPHQMNMMTSGQMWAEQQSPVIMFRIIITYSKRHVPWHGYLWRFDYCLPVYIFIYLKAYMWVHQWFLYYHAYSR